MREEAIKRQLKIGIVLAGYLIVFLAACAAEYIRIHTQGPGVQASDDMYMIGQDLSFVFVFGLAMLIPTGLALYFLRPFRRFWTVLSIAELALALTGLLAGSVYALASTRTLLGSLFEYWAVFAVLRLLATPVLIPGFLVTTVVAPTRSSRWTLLGATAMEGIVGVYIVIHFSAYLLRFH